MHAFDNIISLSTYNFLYIVISFVCNMEDRLKDSQDWSNVALFLLETLWHAIALGRSEIFSELQRTVGPVFIWHPG
jgi:hypothetical protein